jgi:hypothetical protein
MQTSSVESVFARSWALLRSNWSIIIPGLLVGIVVGIMTAILTPAANYSDGAGVTPIGAASFFRHILASVLSVLGTIVAITYTTGMAQAAWERGTATFADGGHAFSEDASRVLVAIVLLFILGLIAAVLAPFTLAVSLLAYAFFFIYTMASAVVSNRSGFDALKESANIALRRPGPTLIVIVGLIVVFIIAGIIAGTLAFIPFLGAILAAVILQAFTSYVTLVIVGEYLALRAVSPSPPAT